MIPDSPQPSPSAWSGPERRRHPRVPAQELPLLLQGDERRPLRVRDLSRSGVAFYSEEPLEVLQQVRFALEIPAEGGPRLVAGQGVVVRCEPVAPALAHYDVAVFFQELDAGGEAVLEAWVARQLEKHASTRSPGRD